MTVDEFRRHKFLPAQWRKELATSGILQAVLQTMEENHPARHAIKADVNEDLSPTRAALELGLTRGYSLYADRLRLLSEAILIPESVGAPTYEEPPKPEEEK